MMKIIKEGPGAGYTIESKGYIFNNGSIRNISVSDDGKSDVRIYCQCDLTGVCKSIEAESYFYSSGVLADVPIKCSNVLIYYDRDDLVSDGIVSASKESIDDVDINKSELIEVIKDTLSKANRELIYGGGWSHATYNGSLSELSDTDRDWFNNVYYDIQATIFIDDNVSKGKEAIEFIDLAVQNENYTEVYASVDRYGDEEFFETEEEAIEYAEENHYDEVVVYKDFYDFNGGPVEGSEERETVWTSY